MIGWSLLDVVFYMTGMLVVAYAYGKWKYSHFARNGIKYIEPPIVFVGNNIKALLGFEHMIQFISRIYNAYPDEKYVGIFDGQKPLLVLRDLELIKQIGMKDFDSFQDHHAFIDSDMDPLFGRSLFSLKGDKWREMRANLSPSFSSSKMRNMFIFVEECAKEMTAFYCKQIGDDEKDMIEVEAKDIFTRYTNDTIASSAYGLKINSFKDKDNEFYTFGKTATNFTGAQILKATAFSFVPRIMKLTKLTFLSPVVIEFFRNLVHGTIKNRKENNIVRPDMLHLLMEAKEGSLAHDKNPVDKFVTGFATVEESEIGTSSVKTKWTDDDLTAQAFSFFIGGFETTSTLLTFFFYEIVRNPDIQKRLQEEFDAFRNSHGDKFVFNDLQKLNYLDMTITETLRMWPPAQIADRICSKAYTMPPSSDETTKTYNIIPDEGVWIPISAIHHDPQYYPNPDKFDPERFSHENKSSINSAAYLPFGIGPRNCIGSRYALMVAKVVIFHLLIEFDFVPIDRTEILITLANEPFTLHTSKGLWLGIKRRKLNL